MNCFRVRNLTLGVAVIAFLAASQHLLSQNQPATAPNVVYTATGTFSPTVVSGLDKFKMAGQPFTISIIANEALTPASHGSGWNKYTKLTMGGTVQSGLIPIPTAISSNSSSLELAVVSSTKSNTMAIFAPLSIMKGLQINLTAVIQMPMGTLSKLAVYPFTAPATLTSTNNTVTYSEPSTAESTTLTIASGTVSTTLK